MAILLRYAYMCHTNNCRDCSFTDNPTTDSFLDRFVEARNSAELRDRTLQAIHDVWAALAGLEEDAAPYKTSAEHWAVTISRSSKANQSAPNNDKQLGKVFSSAYMAGIRQERIDANHPLPVPVTSGPVTVPSLYVSTGVQTAPPSNVNDDLIDNDSFVPLNEVKMDDGSDDIYGASPIAAAVVTLAVAHQNEGDYMAEDGPVFYDNETPLADQPADQQADLGSPIKMRSAGSSVLGESKGAASSGRASVQAPVAISPASAAPMALLTTPHMPTSVHHHGGEVPDTDPRLRVLQGPMAPPTTPNVRASARHSEEVPDTDPRIQGPPTRLTDQVATTDLDAESVVPRSERSFEVGEDGSTVASSGEPILGIALTNDDMVWDCRKRFDVLDRAGNIPWKRPVPEPVILDGVPSRVSQPQNYPSKEIRHLMERIDD